MKVIVIVKPEFAGISIPELKNITEDVPDADSTGGSGKRVTAPNDGSWPNENNGISINIKIKIFFIVLYIMVEF
tara:strand:- start:2001 stop:2222 length:222 start_codon:yes stop_codon:yes gene_type:complete